MNNELTTLTPRSYQTEAATWALERDTGVICLPTGSGKTLVGCMWACDVLAEPSIDRILVLEPSRFLVEQVHEYFTTQTTIDAQRLYGTTSPRQRQSQWDDATVVVTTPQTAYNDIDALSFGAAIIDECHHTTGQHAFAQLVRSYGFDRMLGLSATVPQSKEAEITSLIGDVRRWNWQDLPDAHVPDWFGEVYDTPYPTGYKTAVETLIERRQELDGTRLAGLPSLGIRMLCRDGALALTETLEAETKMGALLGDDVLPLLDQCRDLHKLPACRDALSDHDFEKAVIFVDRVAVATRLATALDKYQTVTILGRLHNGTDGQQEALEQARAPETDVIIATAAGEEGIDLPSADLLIVWSNVVNSVRFIQRLGRIMRQTDQTRPKAAVYLATPDSPDYEALRTGVARATAAGLDIVGLDEDAILSNSIITRVVDTLEAAPSQLDELIATMQQPESTVTRWVQQTVQEGEVCFLYAVPDDLDEWRSAAQGLANFLGGLSSDDETDGSSVTLSPEVRNNFSPTKSHRYYMRRDDLDLIRTDMPSLFDTTTARSLEITYGPSHDTRGKYTTRGRQNKLATDMNNRLGESSQFYATVSYSSITPQFSVQLMYHGEATSDMIEAVTTNANAMISRLEDRVKTE
jgi:superfamily II DNA or RNA helicase